MPSILSNEMTPNCTPLFEVVGHVQVGYGIIDDGHLVEVIEFKRNPLKGENRTETFKVPVSNRKAYVRACGRGAMRTRPDTIFRHP